MSNLIPQIKQARKAATPLVGIASPDPINTQYQLQRELWREFPVLRWDIQQGLHATEPLGQRYTRQLPEDQQPETKDPAAALEFLRQCLPEPGTVIFMDNAHRTLEDLRVVQGLLNLRELFKERQCMVIVFGPYLAVPRELTFHMATFEEDLPGDAELSQTILNVYKSAEVPPPSEEKHKREVETCRGLTRYTTEDTAARSIGREGILIDDLWEFKRRIIRQTQGLEISREGLTYADVGGIRQIKSFLTHLFANTEEAPAAIVHIDEIEKALGGSHSAEAHSVERDALGTILQAMEDYEWSGILAVGAAGCAKSLIAKATGNQFERPTIRMDLGAMKGGIVGTTEANNRAAVQVIKGVAGKKAYFIATANRLETLPPELQRRFTDGIWFFDLPDDQEREQIWRINLLKYGLDLEQPRPHTANYTGSDIRNICRNARRMQLLITESVEFIVPVEHQSGDMIERLRAMAEEKRFLSASYPGHYRKNHQAQTVPSGSRKIQV